MISKKLKYDFSFFILSDKEIMDTFLIIATGRHGQGVRGFFHTFSK
jgi:hypothetical protein